MISRDHWSGARKYPCWWSVHGSYVAALEDSYPCDERRKISISSAELIDRADCQSGDSQIGAGGERRRENQQNWRKIVAPEQPVK